MLNRKKVIFFLIVILLSVFLGFLLYLTIIEKERFITIGGPVWIGYKYFYFAKERGSLPENVRFLELNSASEVTRAYRNNVLDGMFLTTDEVVRNYTDNRAFTIVMVIDTSEGSDLIIAQNYIKSPLMLKGKKLGLEKSSLGYYMLKRFIERTGLNQSEIELVYLEAHEHFKAFIERKIDALVTYEPIATKILKMKEARIIFSSKEIPEEIYDFLVFDREFIMKNKGAVKRLLKEYYKTMKNADKQQVFNHAMKKYRVSANELENILNGIKIFDREQNLKILLNGNLKEKLRKTQQYLDINNSIDYQKLIDNKLIKELYDFNN